MSLFNLHSSYFAIGNPLHLLDRWLNRYRHQHTLRLNQREVELRWSERAARELRRRERPLVIELQLYFSCVVKKRVEFHDRVDFETQPVNDSLALAYRPLASAVCDPLEFARNYPAARELPDTAALNMQPRRVEFDFYRGEWQGQFFY